MSDLLSPALQSKIDFIQAMSDSQATEPPTSVDAYALEADRINEHALVDVDKFVARNFDRRLIDDLGLRITAMRYLDAKCHNERYAPDDAARLWKENKEEAHQLQGDLLGEARLALRKSPEKLAIVDRIAEGSDQADLIADFPKLALLIEDNKAAFEAINFDMDKLARCRELGAILGSLAGKAVDERESRSGTLLRNKAVAHVAEAIDEILLFADVVHKGSDRAKVYVANYFGRYARRKAKPQAAAN